MTPTETCTALRLAMDLHAVWCQESDCPALSREEKARLLQAIPGDVSSISASSEAEVEQ